MIIRISRDETVLELTPEESSNLDEIKMKLIHDFISSMKQRDLELHVERYRLEMELAKSAKSAKSNRSKL